MKDSEWRSTNNFIVLPKLKIVTHWQQDKFRTLCVCEKLSSIEVCSR